MPNLAELPLMPGFEAPVAAQREEPQIARPGDGFCGRTVCATATSDEAGCSCLMCVQDRQQELASMAAVTSVTGRIVDMMVQPAVWVVPPLGAALGTGRIRGMYTGRAAGVSSMADRVRWLNPDTGRVYESETSEHSLNQLELRDGRWRSGSGLLWVPSEV